MSEGRSLFWATRMAISRGSDGAATVLWRCDLSWSGWLAALVAGVGCAVAGGPAATMMFTAWAPYTVARVWLALRGKLPWRLMTFLSEAREAGVLHQSTSVYQFRHRLLRDQLRADHPYRQRSAPDLDG